MTDKRPKLETIDRRTVLKGVGASAVGIGGATGLASAHHVADLAAQCETMPESVVAGNSFGTDVTFESGHGTKACFVAAVSQDGSNWTQVGQEWQDNLTLGEERTFTLNSDIDEDLDAGTYTWRVSATELPVGIGPDCPNPGETDSSRHFIRYDDCELEIRPPVEVQDVEFKGCSEVWAAFDRFPVEKIEAQVNVNGDWSDITIHENDLTKIPGQYGHDTPVFKYSVDNGDKLVGFRIAGDEYENDHRCAENV